MISPLSDFEQEIVAKNLGLVYKIAHRYQGRGLPFEDLVQEGAIGLIRAVRRFNSRKKAKFSSFAWKTINRQIQRAIYQNFLVHIPENYFYQTSQKKIRLVFVSLDENLKNQKENEEDLITFADCIEDRESYDSAVKNAENFLNYLKIQRLFENLTPRERKIVAVKFGFEDGIEKSLRELEDEFKVSNQRLSQILQSIFQKLRTFAKN